jgi:hypothetical protein
VVFQDESGVLSSSSVLHVYSDVNIVQHDNFRDLFEETADSAGILSDNLIMRYNGKRFYPSVTPVTLKIFSEAEFGVSSSPRSVIKWM